MKKLLFAIAFVSAGALAAQTYSISPAKTVTFTAAMNNVTINDIYMINTSSTNLSITWERVSINLPTGWDFSMCDLGTCHTGIPQGPTTMNTATVGGQPAFLGLNIDPGNITGSGVVKVRVYVTGSPANADTLTWYVNANVSGINEVTFEHGIGIYPNPVNDKLRINTGSDQVLSVILTDATGRTLHEVQLVDGTLDVSKLRNGIYFLHVMTSRGSCARRIIKV